MSAAADLLPRPKGTRQRQVIGRLLQDAEGPLSVPELHQRALSELPKLGVATVYRTLKLLQEQGAAHMVTLDGENLYEASGRGHHHHFACRRCQRVFTLHTCPVVLPAGTIYPGGFVIEAHELTLYGLCPDCAEAGL